MPTINVDLHGVKHEDVRRILIAEIERHWDEGCDLIVVTGHSPQMRELVIEVVKEYLLDWEDGLHRGYLRILAH